MLSGKEFSRQYKALSILKDEREVMREYTGDRTNQMLEQYEAICLKALAKDMGTTVEILLEHNLSRTLARDIYKRVTRKST